MDAVIARYLDRLGFDQAPETNLAGLQELQRQHLLSVPFENLDVWMQRPVTTDPHRAMTKIVDEQRGGWCFELNGAFAELLRALGFDVLVLGAATLFSGPSDVVDHMMLEVVLDQSYLVDVGFGQHSPLAPLPLNETVHRQPHLTYELLPSPRGTTLAAHENGVPVPLCRFKRVAHTFDEFAGASDRLQSDPTTIFRRSPFATRLIDPAGTRVTWSNDVLKVTGGDGAGERPVALDERTAVLASEFGIVGVDLNASP